MAKQVKLKSCFVIESIYGAFLVEMAQKCTEFEQEKRPNSFTLWTYTEKFEQNLNAWIVYNHNQNNTFNGNKSQAFDTSSYQLRGQSLKKLSLLGLRTEAPEKQHQLETQYKQILNFMESI